MLVKQPFTVLTAWIIAALMLKALPVRSGSAGYHYNRPFGGPSPNTGHAFAPLSTVSPLPPVPTLPALPTPRPGSYQHSLQQQHPSPAAAYLPSSVSPPHSIAAQITQRLQQAQPQAPRTFTSYGSSSGFSSTGGSPASGYGSSGLGIIAPTAPTAAGNAYSAARTQPPPLRIPFGQSAFISSTATPNAGLLIQNGRPLKQYAVVEVISNDIEPDTTPFLSQPFIDSFRARLDNNHIGADAFAGVQINSRANALVLEQQALATQLRSSPGDAIALGSGGLGYIRLPNGNIYLGSGSLGYISGQQHEQSVRDARTRSGSPIPDALHFGHGPVGGSINTNFLRF